MTGQPAAALMAREATRRRLTEPEPESQGGRRRRAAHVLQGLAHRLDPQVAAPRPALGR